jgi:hypothetical protein
LWKVARILTKAKSVVHFTYSGSMRGRYGMQGEDVFLTNPIISYRNSKQPLFSSNTDRRKTVVADMNSNMCTKYLG